MISSSFTKEEYLKYCEFCCVEYYDLEKYDTLDINDIFIPCYVISKVNHYQNYYQLVSFDRIKKFMLFNIILENSNIIDIVKDKSIDDSEKSMKIKEIITSIKFS